MKSFWVWSAKILVALLVIETWFLYDIYQQNGQLLTANSKLNEELYQVKAALADANGKIESMEKNSIQGQLRKTNKAIISGWETLLQTVEDELATARKSLPSLLNDELPEASPDEEQPQQPPSKQNSEPGSLDQQESKNKQSTTGERT